MDLPKLAPGRAQFLVSVRSAGVKPVRRSVRARLMLLRRGHGAAGRKPSHPRRSTARVMR